MRIRKAFRFEGAHVVRNCSSQRCKYNIHGHSYGVEVTIHSNKLDNGYMVMDFMLLDKVKLLIDSFDHSYSLWEKERTDFKSWIYQNTERVAEIPVSPSAEGYALMFFFIIDKILKNTVFRNNEGAIKLYSVKVHETSTGFAEAFEEDLSLVDFSLQEIRFSDAIEKEWSEEWWNALKQGIPYNNPEVIQNL
ncbi:MAG: 6-carboxytetrahydropterin synthase QueD [Bacteroidetes bacterium]|nr:MAG: 6-carboxytetrahydropterin synthase QueD [Bacteroidota bacterium]PIE88681.1 MAG: 6-carboxytetrahydropterin synthase QueD [Bacteroidota bacterium]